MLWTVYCKTRKVCVMCFVYCVKLSTLSCSTFIHYTVCVPQSPKLKTGYRYENQFYNPGFTNGIKQFCGYRYFCYEIFVSSYSPFFSNLSNKNLQNVKTPKRKLKGFVERYSFKFRTQNTNITES